MDNKEADPDQLKNLWAELMASVEFSKKINEVTDEVVGYLLDDIEKSATEEEKKQIFAMVSS